MYANLPACIPTPRIDCSRAPKSSGAPAWAEARSTAPCGPANFPNRSGLADRPYAGRCVKSKRGFLLSRAPTATAYTGPATGQPVRRRREPAARLATGRSGLQVPVSGVRLQVGPAGLGATVPGAVARGVSVVRSHNASNSRELPNACCGGPRAFGSRSGAGAGSRSGAGLLPGSVAGRRGRRPGLPRWARPAPGSRRPLAAGVGLAG